MGIIETITGVSSAITAMKASHDSIKELHDTYKDKFKKSQKMLTVTLPEKIYVGVPVKIHGTGMGMITIFSGNEKVRTVYSDNGEWFTRIYFSKKGEYKIIVKDYFYEAVAYCTVD